MAHGPAVIALVGLATPARARAMLSRACRSIAPMGPSGTGGTPVALLDCEWEAFMTKADSNPQRPDEKPEKIREPKSRKDPAPKELPTDVENPDTPRIVDPGPV